MIHLKKYKNVGIPRQKEELSIRLKKLLILGKLLFTFTS
jgi:hypothetical protein